MSTVSPASAAISSVRSIGKPWVSCSTNAVEPGTTVPPASLVSSAAASNSREPDAMVRRNDSSSLTATRRIRSRSVFSSGYDGLISSLTVSVSAGITGSSTPSSRALRTVRRSSRRST